MLSHTLGQKSVVADTSGQKSIVTRTGLSRRPKRAFRIQEQMMLRDVGGPFCIHKTNDAWMWDRFYPIVAGFTVTDNCGLKSRVALKDDEVRE